MPKKGILMTHIPGSVMIKNLTRNTVITKDHSVYSSTLQKAMGLMLTLRPKAIVMDFSPSQIVSLHMFLVFYPIDVIGLDNSKNVVSLKRTFRPCSIYSTPKPVRYVLELPSGSIHLSNTRVGDRITF